MQPRRADDHGQVVPPSVVARLRTGDVPIGARLQRRGLRPELAHLSAPPSRYLRKFYYDRLTHTPMATAFLTDLAGADRVAFGTDLPFDMAGPDLDAQLEGVRLASHDRRHIEFDTAAALFGFPSSGED